MRRLRIGMIDLDTSHPPSWLPIIRDLGHEVVAVWDGGSVQEEGFAQRFAEEHGIENAPADLQDMVPLVDVAIIHSCNWDLHVPRARPFVEAGKAVIIDKPMFGNYRDAQQILAWAAEGARIAGGSSLRFVGEARAFLAQPVEERGTPQVVLAGCGVDEFNYGIHAYSIAWSILGGDGCNREGCASPCSGGGQGLSCPAGADACLPGGRGGGAADTGPGAD